MDGEASPVIPRALSEALPRRQLVLVAGPGLSELECPLAGEESATGAPAIRSEGHIQRALEEAVGIAAGSTRDLPEAAEYCQYDPRLGRAFLVQRICQWRTFRQGRPLPLAHRHIARLPWRAVVTTNHDRLIERALEEEMLDFAVRALDSRPEEASPSSPLTVFKIHGDVGRPESLVITRDDLDAYSTRHAATAHAVAELRTGAVLLFAGYGLRDAVFSHVWSMFARSLSGEREGAAFALVGSPLAPEAEYWSRRNLRLVPVGDTRRLDSWLQALGAAAGVPGFDAARTQGRP